jgi:YD repeat-containing protein
VTNPLGQITRYVLRREWEVCPLGGASRDYAAQLRSQRSAGGDGCGGGALQVMYTRVPGMAHQPVGEGRALLVPPGRHRFDGGHDRATHKIRNKYNYDEYGRGVEKTVEDIKNRHLHRAGVGSDFGAGGTSETTRSRESTSF